MAVDAPVSFYAHVIEVLRKAGLPHLITGAYALHHHTGIARNTKDLDLFVHYAQIVEVLRVLARAGYRTELTYSHWLGKVYDGEDFIDLIFSSGNGLSDVDDAFFEHASDGVLFGVPVQFAPVEELIWSKAFVMERERYDGADVAHLLHECGAELDWVRLIKRFGVHHRVLLSHLVLFGFIYPDARALVPTWVIPYLASMLEPETTDDLVAQTTEPVCGGTLLSREQFLPDIEEWGLVDARLATGAMSAQQVAQWTSAISDTSENAQVHKLHLVGAADASYVRRRG